MTGAAVISPAASLGAGDAAAAGPVALVCGGGSLPVTVADALTKQGRGVVLFPLHGWADPALVARYPHHWIYVGQLGRFFRLARSEGCRDLILIGTLVRPPIRHLRLDLETVRVMPRIFPPTMSTTPNAPMVCAKESATPVTRPGIESGAITRRKVRQPEAPNDPADEATV